MVDDEKGKIILLLMASESYHNYKAKKHVRQISDIKRLLEIGKKLEPLGLNIFFNNSVNFKAIVNVNLPTLAM